MIDKLIKPVSDILDKFVADKDLKLKLSHELEKEIISLNRAQIELNAVEASHENVFVAGWRPFIGWACGIALVYHFLIEPIIQYILIINGSNFATPEFDFSQLSTIVMAMLGMSSLRTYEKTQKVMYADMPREDKHFDRDLIKKRLIDFEGLELKLYFCKSNKPTIGVGRNCMDNGITEEEAMYLLNNDISTVIKKLDKHWIAWRKLPITAQYVCIDLVFNMGVNSFMSFRRTRCYMELGEWEKAGDELLNSKYAEQVGRRALFNSEQLKSCKE